MVHLCSRFQVVIFFSLMHVLKWTWQCSYVFITHYLFEHFSLVITVCYFYREIGIIKIVNDSFLLDVQNCKQLWEQEICIAARKKKSRQLLSNRDVTLGWALTKNVLLFQILLKKWDWKISKILQTNPIQH